MNDTQYLVLMGELSGICRGLHHDDVIKWKYFPRYWPFVRGMHRSPVNFPHKDQWRGTLMFSLICARTDSWANHGDADDLSCYRTHYDVIVMLRKMTATYQDCTESRSSIKQHKIQRGTWKVWKRTHAWTSLSRALECLLWVNDDVIKWKHFPRYWPFVRGINRSPVNSPHKSQRR